MAPSSRSSQSFGISKPHAYPSSHGATPSSTLSSSHSSSTMDEAIERCFCRLPACAKSYNRVYDLVRHLTSGTHRAYFLSLSSDTLDTAILAAGVPPAHLSRVQQLLGRENRCTICGAVFSRADALRRHVVEMGHGAGAGGALGQQQVPPGYPTTYGAASGGPVPSAYGSATTAHSSASAAYPQAYSNASSPYGATPSPYGAPGYATHPGQGYAQVPGTYAPAPGSMAGQPPHLYEETMAMWFGQHGGGPPGSSGGNSGRQ